MSKSRLSKSTFIHGLQCEKSLYLYKHHYKLKDPTPTSLQAVFDQGTNIGILAQELFPNGVDASPENHFKMVESVGKTLDFISQGETTIYEATFLYNDVLAALDILVKDNDAWKAYEVKSSTKVTDTYIKDASIQYYTITKAFTHFREVAEITTPYTLKHLRKTYLTWLFHSLGEDRNKVSSHSSMNVLEKHYINPLVLNIEHERLLSIKVFG